MSLDPPDVESALRPIITPAVRPAGDFGHHPCHSRRSDVARRSAPMEAAQDAAHPKAHRGTDRRRSRRRSRASRPARCRYPAATAAAKPWPGAGSRLASPVGRTARSRSPATPTPTSSATSPHACSARPRASGGPAAGARRLRLPAAGPDWHTRSVGTVPTGRQRRSKAFFPIPGACGPGIGAGAVSMGRLRGADAEAIVCAGSLNRKKDNSRTWRPRLAMA